MNLEEFLRRLTCLLWREKFGQLPDRVHICISSGFAETTALKFVCNSNFVRISRFGPPGARPTSVLIISHLESRPLPLMYVCTALNETLSRFRSANPKLVFLEACKLNNHKKPTTRCIIFNNLYTVCPRKIVTYYTRRVSNIFLTSSGLYFLN